MANEITSIRPNALPAYLQGQTKTERIGNIDAQGLERHNGRWVSAKHEDAKVTIHLDIRGGVGNITLLAN